jgi:polysaccharide export outer membrane protein
MTQFVRTLILAGLLAVCVLAQAPDRSAAADLPGVPEEAARATVARPEAAAGVSVALRGPVDEDRYVVGPGDRLAVIIWGPSTMTLSAPVSPEGDLALQGVAPIPVAGLTLAKAKARVIDSLDTLYRNVKIDVSLAAIRTMRVSVLGNVVVPGEYTGTALDLAGEMIDRAGGLGPGASSRNIAIRRRGGGSERVDLIRYLNAGDMDANPPILDGDVVFVPNSVAFVEVDGAVAWPGTYELGPDDTLAGILEIAGGFARGAVRDTVFLHRFVDDRTTMAMPIDVSRREQMQLPLVDGDQVYVRAVTEWHERQRVFVEGEVVHPGPYGINEGVDRLSDVLARAGGPTELASLRDARVFRATDPESIDLEFKRLSTVSVSEMEETELAYWKTRLQNEPGAVVADFGKALAGDPDHDVLLMDGDRIVIPRVSLTVKVAGQVANPGLVSYVPGEKFSYYVRAAGGYESGARTNAVKVIRRQNGEWIPAGRAGALEPGEEVWVPQRREGATWRMLRDVASFAASVATAYLLIDQATAQ